MAQVSRTTKIAGVLIALAVTVVIAFQTIGPRRTMARLYEQTMPEFGYPHTTQPPWPYGNGFSVLPRWAWLRERYVGRPARVYLPWLSKYVGLTTGWYVVNMHAENLEALSRQRGFQWVKVEKVGERHGEALCLVVDKRVPREWLLETPRMDPLRMRQKLKLERPECFREDPRTRALIGTTWILVDREDPEGALARLFPGDRIHFGIVELSCGTAAEAVLARRSWEPGSLDTAFSLGVYSLGVYEVHGDWFTGIRLEVSRSGDTMTLIRRGTVGHDARGTTFGPYQFRGSLPRVRYRLVSPNNN